MGNTGHYSSRGGGGASSSLVYRIRYNDPSLTELGLTAALENNDGSGDGHQYSRPNELDAVIRYLPHNRTIRSAVLFDAFTAHVLQQTKWKDFIQALASVQSLRQVELLETSVPFDTLRQLLQNNPTLETLAVTDGIELGSVTVQAIAELSSTIREQQEQLQLQEGEASHCRLKEFVLECNFSAIVRILSSSTTTTYDDDKHDNDTSRLLDPLLSAMASSCSNLSLLGLINSGLKEELQPSLTLVSPDVLFQFARTCRHSLKTLGLSGCGLNNEHFRALQAAFSPSISCSTTSASASASASHSEESISSVEEESYSAIEQLQLQRNLATDDGFEALLEWVQQSSHHSSGRLRELATDAKGNLQDQLELWVFWNHCVRRPLGRYPPRYALGHMVARMAEHPDSLFLLLRHFPEIYCLQP